MKRAAVASSIRCCFRLGLFHFYECNFRTHTIGMEDGGGSGGGGGVVCSPDDKGRTDRVAGPGLSKIKQQRKKPSVITPL